MINPLQVSFPRERKDGSWDSAAIQLCEKVPWSGREAIVAPSYPSTSAILMFYAQIFPSEPAVGPEFRLDGPCIRTHPPLAKVRMLEPPRTFLRFSRKRTAASGLPA